MIAVTGAMWGMGRSWAHRKDKDFVGPMSNLGVKGVGIS